eukprot:scaffold32175_cov36-Prasinocladus_malaysianus.AAC.1
MALNMQKLFDAVKSAGVQSQCCTAFIVDRSCWPAAIVSAITHHIGAGPGQSHPLLSNSGMEDCHG